LLSRDHEPRIPEGGEVTRDAGLPRLHDLRQLTDRQLFRKKRTKQPEARLVSKRAKPADPVR
jgi:hypothetical protein